MPRRLKARMVGTLQLCFFALVEMEGMVDKLVVVKNLNGFQSFWSRLWPLLKLILVDPQCLDIQNTQNGSKSPVV